MRNRMDILRDRAKPSRGSMDHQKLKADLGNVEPQPGHPHYEDFIRLTSPKPMGRPRGSDILPSGMGPTEMGKSRYQEHLRVHKSRINAIKGYYDSNGAPIDDWAAKELYRQELEHGIPAMRKRLPVEETRESWPVLDPTRGHRERLAYVLAAADSWEHEAATKPKPKPPRKPEEVWYDVHKHPEGVPGGMGKSPEHHLRGRGWKGHEINEGSGKKTIQYRHHDYPNFVISYGGGSGTKPDHNFRILHMGVNTNIPKVTRAYSVAEAMNKVEELHGLNSGLVVQPMTHDSAVAPAAKTTQPGQTQQWLTPAGVRRPRNRKDMNNDFADHPIGIPDKDFPTSPDKAADWVDPIKPPNPYSNRAPMDTSVKKKETSKISALQIAQRVTWED